MGAYLSRRCPSRLTPFKTKKKKKKPALMKWPFARLVTKDGTRVNDLFVDGRQVVKERNGSPSLPPSVRGPALTIR